MTEKTRTTEADFAQHVRQGLTDYPKHLSSRFIYDAYGDELFRQIMKLPEYYLTASETEILTEHAAEICSRFRGAGEPFDLIELGAGDGTKTRILLRELLNSGASFRYMPVDISENALIQLEAALSGEFPPLPIHPWQGTYFDILEEIDQLEAGPKVVLFLGSNIGNLLHPQAVQFLQRLRGCLNPGDLMLIGFDQKKHPKTVLEAYNDPGGVTAAFNKNLLHRINRELDGDFNADDFLHWEVYDPESGTAKSYLVARRAQRVRIAALDLEVSFEPWETIHTEISQKYDDRVVGWLAGEAGLEIVGNFGDPKGFYKDYLLRAGR